MRKGRYPANPPYFYREIRYEIRDTRSSYISRDRQSGRRVTVCRERYKMISLGSPRSQTRFHGEHKKKKEKVELKDHATFSDHATFRYLADDSIKKGGRDPISLATPPWPLRSGYATSPCAATTRAPDVPAVALPRSPRSCRWSRAPACEIKIRGSGGGERALKIPMRATRAPLTHGE